MKLALGLFTLLFCFSSQANVGVLAKLTETMGERCDKDILFSIEDVRTETVEIDQGVEDKIYHMTLNVRITPLGETSEVFVQITESAISNPAIDNYSATQFVSHSPYCK